MSVNINVRDFQSIREADIEVDGFTILVGESSQGKSACLRAVRAACENKFRQGFLRHGADTITVGLSYGDNPNPLIVRKTKKESPTYELGDLVFQKLNRTVPPEIDGFNNFGSIDAYEQKYPLNFFSQFSKPLLLEFSQKRILEILSSSKAFDDMNEANSKLNKRKEQNSGAFKQLSSMITDNKQQLSEYNAQEQRLRDGIGFLTERLESLRTCENSLRTAEDLTGVLTDHLNGETRSEGLKRALSACERTTDLSNRVEALGKLQECIDARGKAVRASETAQERLSLCERHVSLSDERNALRDDLLKELERHISDSRDAHARIKSLTSVLTLAERAVEVGKSLNAAHASLNSLTRLTELMDAYRAAHKTAREKQDMIDNHICPICGNRIN